MPTDNAPEITDPYPASWQVLYRASLQSQAVFDFKDDLGPRVRLYQKLRLNHCPDHIAIKIIDDLLPSTPVTYTRENLSKPKLVTTGHNGVGADRSAGPGAGGAGTV